MCLVLSNCCIFTSGKLFSSVSLGGLLLLGGELKGHGGLGKHLSPLLNFFFAGSDDLDGSVHSVGAGYLLRGNLL